MKRSLIFIALTSVFFGFYSCSFDNGITFPSTPVELSFPTDKLLCIDNTITFDWNDAENSLNENLIYTIVIATDRAFTDVVETSTTTMSEITITLEKSVAYYWKVTGNNTATNQIEISAVFSFFTKGDGVVNYAPFTAQLVSPIAASQVGAGTVDLSWTGSDVDAGDTLTYELYFGESTTPVLIENSLDAQSYTVTVETGKTYYWKVNVSDQNGAKSIGQIWNFIVN